MLQRYLKADDLLAENVDAVVDAVVRAIPPAWPLDATVAVNPFVGQTGQRFVEAAAILERAGNVPLTMPADWYEELYASGKITEQDLKEAWTATPAQERPTRFEDIVAGFEQMREQADKIPSVADLAAARSGQDWPGIISDRIGVWAAGYFDTGQALWRAGGVTDAYANWREHALHDLTPEIAGLSRFAERVSQSPLHADESIRQSVAVLGLKESEMHAYFHSLLTELGGWSQLARHRQWVAERDGSYDDTPVGLLAVRLFFEASLFESLMSEISGAWQTVRNRLGAPVAPSKRHLFANIWQSARERFVQRSLSNKIDRASQETGTERPDLQAAFCIDVRSEPFRRALEGVAPDIETIGFAGFFGLGTSHTGFASDISEHRLPVLLSPALGSRSGPSAENSKSLAARYAARAKRAFGRFKLAAVSSFAFVEAMGPVYAAKLLGDSFAMSHRKSDEPEPMLHPAISLEKRVSLAKAVLSGMSLTRNFAPIVLIAGHGAIVTNNPHASALHCGACGGHAGDVNARLLAQLLNDGAVRHGLRVEGIDIPADTVFVAALHDTTADEVQIFAQDQSVDIKPKRLAELKSILERAGHKARTARALKLPGASSGESLISRGKDWSEIRPEWGLAGCNAFIAARRDRTRHADLEGEAFLHDYDWQQDSGFKVLETILTAPVVVASWISLQYYGSSVAPEIFGGGNKLLHNVTGGIGVLEGNGGVLRTGLPWQSVHNGETFVHEPLRLSVCVEAPKEAVSDILERNPSVRDLFENNWLHLLILENEGGIAWRYRGDLEWARFSPASEAAAGVSE